MAPVAIGNSTVVLLRAPLAHDSRSGSFYRDWDNPVQIPITGCSVQPYALSEKLSVENEDNREFARSSIRVYAPADSPIPEPTDRALYRGVQWEVYAFPDQWFDLDDRPHHIAFSMRRREG